MSLAKEAMEKTALTAPDLRTAAIRRLEKNIHKAGRDYEFGAQRRMKRQLSGALRAQHGLPPSAAWGKER